MSYKPRYEKGDWIAVCDSCGRYFKASTLRKRWDGFMVCTADWEPRHPQDFARGKAEKQIPPWTRPKASDTFVLIPTEMAIAGIAVAGRARVGFGYPVGVLPPSSFTL